MPASFTLFDTYDEHLTAGIDGAREGSTAMDDIADGAAEMATAPPSWPATDPTGSATP